MTVVPAQAAGVAEIAVVVPPTRFGGYNTDLLAACRALGVTEVYRIGGAQAVAALAYGVEGIAAGRQDRRPGQPVRRAGQEARLRRGRHRQHRRPERGRADRRRDRPTPDIVAADLISQAEHSPGASILLTWEPASIDQVARALDEQLARLSRGDLARDSLERFGALILVRDEDEAVRLSNLFAPEHLHVSTADPERLLPALTERRRDLPGAPHAGGRGRLRGRARRTCCPPAAPRGGPRASRPTTSSSDRA